MAKHKLDIFEVLGAVNQKNYKFFDNLTEEEFKSVSPYVLMRWMFGTNDTMQIHLLNELMNPLVFNLQSHPDLLLKLLTVCAPGKSRKYQWIAPPKKDSNLKVTLDVVKRFYGYSTREAKDTLHLLSNDDIMEYAEYLNIDTPDLTTLKKELKNRCN